jgi:general nucleoside transport system permease protein
MPVLDKILYDAVLSAAPLILAVLGGIFAHRANVLNIALEGMMLLGAFCCCLFTILLGSYPLALFLSMLVTTAFGFVFSYFGISRRGNVIIVGLAINLFASAITAFLLQVMGKAELVARGYVVASARIRLPIVADIPVLGPMLSGHTPLTYFSYLAILGMWVLMFRTPFGVHVRVAGENEEAARAVGIRTTAIKYASVIIGAVCCALAGASLSMDDLGGIFTKDMTAGRGFIAIAAIFCGRGKPGASALYAIAFGLARSLALNLSIYAGSAARLFNAIPYLLIVAVLLVASIVKNRNTHLRSFQND